MAAVETLTKTEAYSILLFNLFDVRHVYQCSRLEDSGINAYNYSHLIFKQHFKNTAKQKVSLTDVAGFLGGEMVPWVAYQTWQPESIPRLHSWRKELSPQCCSLISTHMLYCQNMAKRMMLGEQCLGDCERGSRKKGRGPVISSTFCSLDCPWMWLHASCVKHLLAIPKTCLFLLHIRT